MPSLDEELAAHVAKAQPSLSEEAGAQAIEMGAGAQSFADAIVGGIGGAVGTIPDQIAGMTNIPGAVAGMAENLYEGNTGIGDYLTQRSGPQMVGDLAVPAGMFMGPVAGPAFMGGARGLANAYEMPEGTPFNDRVEQFTTDLLSPFALPGVIKGVGLAAKGAKSGASALADSVRGGPGIKMAPMSDRLATSVIFSRPKRLSKSGEGEIAFKEGEHYNLLKQDGVISPSIPFMVNEFSKKKDMLRAETRSVLSKPVGPNGATIGQAPAAFPSRLVENSSGEWQSIPAFPRAEKLIQEFKGEASTRSLMDEQLTEFRRMITGYEAVDPMTGQPTRYPGITSIDELQEMKKDFSIENSAAYKKMGGNPELIPDELDQLMRAAGRDIKDALGTRIKEVAGMYGDKAKDLAAKFQPLNEKWSLYLDMDKDFRKLADVAFDPRKSNMNFRAAMGAGLGGAAGYALGAPGMGALAGASLGSPAVAMAASTAMDKFSALPGQIADIPGMRMLGGAMQNPRVMGPIASLSPMLNQGMNAQAQILPRTPEAVMANPQSVLPLLPPEMQPQFMKALEGGKEDVNQFMTQAMVNVPGLAQIFAQSWISPEEFGGRVQDPMTIYGMYEEVTSQMMRGDLDPRRAYRAQKDAVQGKVPKLLQ